MPRALNLRPVLKIHHAVSRRGSRNPNAAAMRTSTFASEISWNSTEAR
jgi:hypothetical protein